MNALASEGLGDVEPSTGGLFEGGTTPLAERTWTAGESADGAWRLADTEWRQVTFRVTRESGASGRLSSTVRRLDGTVEHQFDAGSAEVPVTLDEVSLGARGTPLGVQVQSLTVVAYDVETATATTAVSSTAGTWYREDETASWSLDGETLSVEWSGGSPAALVRVFSPVTCQQDGDWVELSFAVRLTAVPEAGGAELYWGLYDTHPEEGAIRYRAELTNNGYGIANPASEVHRRGRGLIEMAVIQKDGASPAANHVAVASQLLAAASRTIGGHARAESHAMGADGQVMVIPTYDAAGRFIGTTAGDHVSGMEYDAEGRMRSASVTWQPVTWREPSLVSSQINRFDAFGYRVAMQLQAWIVEVTPGGSLTPTEVMNHKYRFVYDGPDVVVEYLDKGGDGTLDRKRIYWNQPAIDQKIGFVDLDGAGNATVYYYVTDQVGSVLQVLDATGKLVEQYAYDAFGNQREELCTYRNGFDNRYRFHGRERDPFTGQYYYRYRQYDPDLGRFTNPDHQVDRADRFGPCNYAFCQNNPLVYADPMGLRSAVGDITKGYLGQRLVEQGVDIIASLDFMAGVAEGIAAGTGLEFSREAFREDAADYLHRRYHSGRFCGDLHQEQFEQAFKWALAVQLSRSPVSEGRNADYCDLLLRQWEASEQKQKGTTLHAHVGEAQQIAANSASYVTTDLAIQAALAGMPWGRLGRMGGDLAEEIAETKVGRALNRPIPLPFRKPPPSPPKPHVLPGEGDYSHPIGPSPEYGLYARHSAVPNPRGVSTMGVPVQSHHPIQQAWAHRNLPGYNPNLAPTVTLETGAGKPHSIIGARQMERERARRAAGHAPFSTSIDDQLRFIVEDFRAAGFSDTDIATILAKQYTMLDRLGVSFVRPIGF